MKILLIGEFSGLHKELKSALVGLGHQVVLAAGSDHWKKFDSDIGLGYGDNRYSYTFRQFLFTFLNLNKLVGYDVVHIVNFYMFPHSPLLNLYLVKYLKKHNKIVTLSGAGCDPFFVKYAEMTMRYSPIPHHEVHDRKKLYYMRNEYHLEIMREFVYCVDGLIPIMYEYYSTFCEAGYEKKTSEPIPIPIDCSRIEYAENITKDKIVFFHGLSRRGFKGTFLIEKCFSDLKKKYPSDVECVIEGRLPFSDYMRLISKINISVDQVYSYSLALNALYSMAQGKIVVGGAEPESSVLYGGELPPVYNAIPDRKSLGDIFERILDDRANFSAISFASREFVVAKHFPRDVALKYLKFWDQLSS